MTQEIQSKLDRLADMRSQIDLINLRFDELRNQVLTPEIKTQLDDIEAERKSALDAANEGASKLEAEIKDAVLEAGESIKSKYLMAVWSKPRVSWDNRGLNGYMVAHPEIQAFRKVGSPSVSIRVVKS